MARVRVGEDQAQSDLDDDDGEDDGNGYLAGAYRRRGWLAGEGSGPGDPAPLGGESWPPSQGPLAWPLPGVALTCVWSRGGPSGIASPRRPASESAVHEHSCEPLPAALISSFGHFG